MLAENIIYYRLIYKYNDSDDNKYTIQQVLQMKEKDPKLDGN
jgi:hypothetical protein